MTIPNIRSSDLYIHSYYIHVFAIYIYIHIHEWNTRYTHDHYMRMYDITCCIAVGRVSTLKQPSFRMCPMRPWRSPLTTRREWYDGWPGMFRDVFFLGGDLSWCYISLGDDLIAILSTIMDDGWCWMRMDGSQWQWMIMIGMSPDRNQNGI